MNATPPNPYIVATGTTSAFLSDERLLREFLVGEKKVKSLMKSRHNAILYLINDSYDALSERQLRIAVNKDDKLFDRFKPFCGRPIAEIPDPYECHDSFAEHFMQAQLKRLRNLDVHPVVLDAYRAYQGGYYKPYTDIVFEQYNRIQQQLSERFDSYSMRNLFRVQCPKCQCLDATNIDRVVGSTIFYTCERCGEEKLISPDEVKGKLSWKLDCAARWNMYNIDMEAFSKSHITDLGSFGISKYISETFFQGKVPEPLKYGEIKLSRELSYRLLEILPPAILKKLYTEKQERDLDLTRDSIKQFCHRCEISPGVSYVDFVKNELPLLVVGDDDTRKEYPGAMVDGVKLDSKTLIQYGNRFSGFYYHKEYDRSLSGVNAIASAPREVTATAQEILQFAIQTRRIDHLSQDDQLKAVTRHLQSYQNVSGVFPYMRKIMSQQKGPGIAPLLCSLPLDYLEVILSAIGYYLGDKQQHSSKEKALNTIAE